ncbi:hypothetical protein IEQ34_016581 [Dendrobium chrysotoxum]|uniref:Uncharacterized protein n=1 Tax=Dendrobium chrysotoxum TaxID=161865 RepID=A0AAV7GFQ0_DENCH|nr:hypothetical protein IEQ34_016581 [Dendrobium chrysotoxum]
MAAHSAIFPPAISANRTFFLFGSFRIAACCRLRCGGGGAVGAIAGEEILIALLSIRLVSSGR